MIFPHIPQVCQIPDPAEASRTREADVPTTTPLIPLHQPGNRLSVTLITLNEEANLPRCLASVRGLADEILVVDCGSTDRTRDIALEAGALVHTHPFHGYGAQKQRALELASGDWILWLDADEWLDTEARSRISQLLTTPPAADIGAYQLRRLDFYLGRWIRHAGWSVQWKVRLVRRGCACWSGDLIHESLQVTQGLVRHLSGRVRHHPYQNIGHQIEKLNRYTEILAVRDQRIPTWRIWSCMLIEPPWVFLHRYFLQLGCIEGFYGFMISALSTFYCFLHYAKIWQLKRGLHDIKPGDEAV
jgi:glycosyltransferase involved in cell wall biosynthesis